MEPKPQLYMFTANSLEPKTVEYEGESCESGRKIHLVKATGDLKPAEGDSGSLICHYDSANNITQAMFIFIGSWDEERGIYNCCRLNDCVNYLWRNRGITISLTSPSQGCSLTSV